jgi:predicted anti-sigma-YlaC factor YlaD
MKKTLFPSISLGLAVLFTSGCSIKKIAMNQLGDALSGGGTVFSSDEDPELVKDALPFSLKLMESVLAETPEHRGLLLSLASGFTQYGYGFVQLDADEIEDDDYDEAQELRDRATRLYLRAKRYGMRALEVKHPNFEARLINDREMALKELTESEIPYLYWTGLSWTAAIALSLDDPEQLGNLAIAESMLERALELNPDWDFGTLRGFFVTYEMSRIGGTEDPIQKATEHFIEAKRLSGGLMASNYVAYAESVAIEKQDKELFVTLLNQALAIDLGARPNWRLSNKIYQRRAKWLLTRLDWYFF